jgi:hypothetical protein
MSWIDGPFLEKEKKKKKQLGQEKKEKKSERNLYA